MLLRENTKGGGSYDVYGHLRKLTWRRPARRFTSSTVRAARRRRRLTSTHVVLYDVDTLPVVHDNNLVKKMSCFNVRCIVDNFRGTVGVLKHCQKVLCAR